MAPLQCQPPIDPMGAFSLPTGVNSLPSGHCLARSSFGPYLQAKLCMFMYINTSWPCTSSLHSSWSSLHVHDSACMLLLCYFFSMNCNTSDLKLGPISWDRVLAQILKLSLYWTQQGRCTNSSPIRKHIERTVNALLLKTFKGQHLQTDNTEISRQHM